MDGLEIFVVIECVLAILLLFIIIAVASSIKKRRKKQQEIMLSRGLMYGQNGLYAPVTEEEMRLIQEQANAYSEQQYNDNNFYGK